MMPRTKRFQLVELIIPASVTGNNQQTYFQNQPQLQSISGDRRIFMKGLATYSQDTLASSPLTTASPVATAADLLNGVLVLSVDGEYSMNMIPLSDLCRTQTTSLTPSNFDLFLIDDVFKIDWTKSYVQTIVAPAIVPFSYIFAVYYDYKPGWWGYTENMPETYANQY